MKTLFTLLALGTLLFSSCESENKEEKAKALEREVMAIHDEVMPWMGTISDQSDSLKAHYNHLKMHEAETDSLLLEQILETLEQLKTADEAMMAWMRQYERPAEDMKHEDKMTYLEGEKEKMTEVKRIMEEAIDRADRFLDSLRQMNAS